jgi:photosystem II stability/assembly factor-like uncharacterized protein
MTLRYTIYRLLFFAGLLGPVVTTLQAQGFLQPLPGPGGLTQWYDFTVLPSGRIFLAHDHTVHYSDDRGDSWTEAGAGLPPEFVAFHPNPVTGQLFAVGRDVLIKWYAFQPASNDWAPAPFGGSIDYENVEGFDPQGRLWRTQTTGGLPQLQYSTNNGQSFVTLLSAAQLAGSPYRVTFFNDEHNLVATAGEPGYLYHFNFNTAAVDIVATLPTEDTAVHIMQYNPATGTAFYALQDGTTFRSTDYGLTWDTTSLYLNGYGESIHMAFASPDTIYLDTGYDYLFSTDDGASWQHVPTGFSDGVPDGPAKIAADGTWYLLHFNAVFRSDDDGATLTDITAPLPYPHVTELQQSDAGTLYAGNFLARPVRSTDFGETWAPVVLPDPAYPYPARVFVLPDNVVIAGDGYDFLYRSFDDGLTWEPFPAPGGGLFADQVGNIYARDTATYYQSSDHGSTWQPINLGPFFAFPVISKARRHPNGDLLYSDGNDLFYYKAAIDSIHAISFSGNNVLGLEITTDGEMYILTHNVIFDPLPKLDRLIESGPNGSTYNPVSFFSNKTMRSIAADRDGYLYVATTEGIYKGNSVDSWSLLGTAPEVLPSLRVLTVGTDQHLYAGFAGRAVHRSTSTVAVPALAAAMASVAPNPFDSGFSVALSGPDLPAAADMTLYDALGRAVRRETVALPGFSVPRAGLAAGLYYLLVTGPGGPLATGTVIAR